MTNETSAAGQEIAATVRLRFMGAAGTVTGSKHLLTTPEKTILVDCGMFQGIKALREMNWQMLPVDASAIDVVLLTHAHLDHCGYIPLLVKQGFGGKIYMTDPTRELTEIILLDSAMLQEEDAERANKYGYSKHHPALPLYDHLDAERAFEQFVTADVDTWVPLSEHIRFRFRPNGHILGATFIEMDCYGRRIVFSGDVGRTTSLLMPSPVRPAEADYLVVESTYGNRLHPDVDAEMELAEIIDDAMHKKGNLLIPSFAVGRAQELMVLIAKLKKKVMIPDVPVYLDSPMGEKATAVTKQYREWHRLDDKEMRAAFDNVRYVPRVDDTMRVLRNKEKKIIIAASGMLTGGRVLHYLKKYLPDGHNTILLAGYQAEGTRGRDLQEHAHELRIHGEFYPVNAEVRNLAAISAHADQAELLDWLSAITKKPEMVFVVHGEPAAAQAFRLKLEHSLKWNAQVPALNQEFVLFSIDQPHGIGEQAETAQAGN